MPNRPRPHDAFVPDSAGADAQGILPPMAGAAEAGDARTRRMYLVVLGVALAWLLFWYRDTALSMVEIWNRSDTYAHGFVIAPISAWLVWRRRDFLRGLPITPSLLGIAAGVLSGFAWLLGELASVASVSQFALVGMIISLVWAVMGTAVVRTYAFPLGFLFFLVPFGEFMFPTMMDWTTEFIIGALRLTGIPVYAEGRTLVIPSGRWQVVEGCSGVRYLIASVVVGSLYAYLNYRSMKKRLLFTAASIAMPVLANWLRAYGIVMIGHLSDNRLATGVDHLVYGWVFFGIIILALFWIGTRWQEDEERAPVPPSAGSSSNAAGVPGAWGGRAVLLGAALVSVLAWSPVLAYLDRQGQHGPVQFAEVPAVGDWQPVDMDRLPEWSPRYTGMRGEYRASWALDGRVASAYVGYYRDQGAGEELINSENRVLPSKDPVWTLAGYGGRDAALGGESIPVLSTEMRSVDGRILVWHSYWIGGRWTTSDYVAKLYLALSRLRGEGDDSAVVMVYAPFAGEERATAGRTLEQFLGEMGPGLSGMLDRTMVR